MVIRLLLLAGALITASYWVWRLRPHPLLRTPRRWKALATRSAEFGRGVSYRDEVAQLLVDGRVVVGESLLGEMDRMVEHLGRWVELQGRAGHAQAEIGGELGAEIGAEIAGTLGALRESRDAILDVARSELRLQVDDLQLQLKARRELLNDVVKSHEELSEMFEEA